jgi:hypothetical protein
VFAIWLPRVRIRDDRLVARVFGNEARGIPTVMQDSEDLPDDVPVADAVEQQRTTSEPVPDEEATAEPADEVPFEAAAPDWQEQLETVDLDPDLEEGR